MPVGWPVNTGFIVLAQEASLEPPIPGSIFLEPQEVAQKVLEESSLRPSELVLVDGFCEILLNFNGMYYSTSSYKAKRPR